MQTIMWLHKFRKNKRGFSTVIVVVLSLIILVVVVTNVVLWSYTMNQLDWEKMNEDVKITDVTRVTNSSWFTVENEYTVNEGSLVSGDYADTKEIGGSYETFVEGSPTLQETLHPNAGGTYANWGKENPNGLAHWDCCDENPPDDDGSYVETSIPTWAKETYNMKNHTGSGNINWVRVYLRAKLTEPGTFNIRTLVRTHATDYESSGISLSTSYEDKYTHYDKNPYTGLAWTWDELDSLQAGASGQRVGNVATRMTVVWVVVNYSPLGVYELDLNGTFSIEVSTYPLDYIKSVEIQLRYRANETLENWYLKAYNWASMVYNDFGFNNTLGHAPATEWSVYAVNLTDKWRNYVDDNGFMYVKLQDNEADVSQTRVDIDFLAVRAVVDGTKFTFQNEGSLTLRLVSLWINNSTDHKRYDISIFINSGDTRSYIRGDITLPKDTYTVKIVTERGNIAVYSEG